MTTPRPDLARELLASYYEMRAGMSAAEFHAAVTDGSLNDRLDRPLADAALHGARPGRLRWSEDGSASVEEVAS